MEEFKIKLLTIESGTSRYDSPVVDYSPEIAEWLDARLVWVLNRARRLAPTAPRLLFSVTFDGETKTVEVEDKGNEVALSLVA